MDTRIGASCLTGTLALVLGACGAYDDRPFDDAPEFRSGDGWGILDGGDDDDDDGGGGGVIIIPPGVPSSSGGGGGGDDDNWISNGLSDPSISGVDPDFALCTSDGLSETVGLLVDPDKRGVVEYLFECALPAGDSVEKIVDGETLVFEGALGLAPEWRDGACDAECQEWVSACLLARTNISGEAVDIWVSAAHPNVGVGMSYEFPLHEATYYGNLFEDEPSMHVCNGWGMGVIAAFMQGRTCSGESPEECGFESWGSCYAPRRCRTVGLGFPQLFTTRCAAGDGDAVRRYRSISTFVRMPRGWEFRGDAQLEGIAALGGVDVGVDRPGGLDVEGPLEPL